MRDNLNAKQLKGLQQTLRASMLFLAIGLAVLAVSSPHPNKPFIGGLLLTTLGFITATAAEGLVTGPSKRKVAALAKDQRAVSPVIGVILMVAITVVLAAVVFTLVTQLSNHSAAQGSQASFEAMTPTTTTLPFRVVSVDTAFDWSTCLIKDQAGATRTFTVNGATAVAGQLSTAGDVLQVGSLTTKTTYDLLLNCGGHATGTMHGTTL